MMQYVRTLAGAVLSALWLTLTLAHAADHYPSKPVRMVASASGGGGDLATRIIAAGLSNAWGEQVIVDNRGIIGAEIVARSPPDGYTMLFYGSTIWLQPLLREHVAWDPIRDFATVTWAIKSPNVLVVHPSVPVNSTKELIALAKAKPAGLNYSSGATGTSSHLAAELFKYTAGVDIVRIPYKSGATEIADLLGGQVQLTFGSGGSVGQHVRSGKLRALAVTTAEPSPLFPGLATIAATGVPGYEAAAMSGVWVPVKTPAPMVKFLNQEIVKVLAKPEVKEKYFIAGVDTVGSTPELFALKIKSEMERLGKVIKAAGIKED
jgi:tripartite-type tricarboxylate transporter receptor subunit TctC